MLQINEGHKSELMDRLWCNYVMFEELICNHPSSSLIHKEILVLSDALLEAYHAAGRIAFEEG